MWKSQLCPREGYVMLASTYRNLDPPVFHFVTLQLALYIRCYLSQEGCYGDQKG